MRNRERQYPSTEPLYFSTTRQVLGLSSRIRLEYLSIATNEYIGNGTEKAEYQWKGKVYRHPEKLNCSTRRYAWLSPRRIRDACCLA